MIHDVSRVPADRRIETHRAVPFTSAQVFQAFRDPAILARWWGPTGFTNTFDEFDFREGGSWRFTMHSPNGKNFRNESRFLRIIEPSLIVLDHECAPEFQAQFHFGDRPDGCEIDWFTIFEDSRTRGSVAKVAADANEQNLDRLVAVLGKGAAEGAGRTR